MHGLALCAGGGGLELGVGIAAPGHRVVCYVEREAYAAAALVAGMEAAALDPAPVWDDLATFDGRPWRGVVDLVTAGYPCQGESNAGQRRGTDDERWLWPHVARIVDEVRPRRVFCENVGAHLHRSFRHVLDDLQGLGYRVAAGLFSAADVGAKQQRQRLFILASAIGARLEIGRCVGGNAGPQCATIERGGRELGADEGLPLHAPGPADDDAWIGVLQVEPALEPTLCRMADGVAFRVDRLGLLGNGVHPLAAAYAYRTLDAALSADAAGGRAAADAAVRVAAE